MSTMFYSRSSMGSSGGSSRGMSSFSVTGGAVSGGLRVSQASRSFSTGLSGAGFGRGAAGFGGGAAGFGGGAAGFGRGAAGFGGGAAGFGRGAAGFGGGAAGFCICAARFGRGAAGFGGGAAGFGGGAAGFGGGAAGFGGGAGGGVGWVLEDNLIWNEKLTMQNLNDRLAAYLSKVAALMKANAELELKIKEFAETKISPTSRDYSGFLVTITELQAKIQDSLIAKGSVLLNIDNAQLAVDDFKMKFDNELVMRQSVEADIARLKLMLEDLGNVKNNFTLEIENLMAEKDTMKKDHEENLLSLRSQMSGQVNVGVEAAPQQDLTKVMEEIREYYEDVARKNSKELESWFQNKENVLNKDKETVEVSLKSTVSESKELHSQYQSLEIELQSQQSMKASLEISLVDVKNSFAVKMSGLQNHVFFLEEQLQQLRADLENQNQEYQILLDIKIKLEEEISEYRRLETEISEYRRLLDTEASGSSVSSSSSSSTKTLITKVVEETIPG